MLTAYLVRHVKEDRLARHRKVLASFGFAARCSVLLAEQRSCNVVNHLLALRSRLNAGYTPNTHAQSRITPFQLLQLVFGLFNTCQFAEVDLRELLNDSFTSFVGKTSQSDVQ